MRLTLPLLALAAAGTLQAQTSLTFTGSVYMTFSQGIVAGTPVSFTLVTSGNPLAWRNESQAGAYFADYELSDKDLFQSFSGTAISGNWVRATLDGGYSEIGIRPIATEGQGSFYAWMDAPTLSFFGVSLHSIFFNFNVAETLQNLPGVYNYNDIWSSYHGTYSIQPAIGSSMASFEFGMADGSSTYFAMNSFTIGPASPVPEPSTYGLALGGLALAAVGLRRRARK